MKTFRNLIAGAAGIILGAIALVGIFGTVAPQPASAELLGGNQVNPRAPVTTGFSNCPSVVLGIAAGDNQTNLTANFTNAVKLIPGRDLTLISEHTLGSNTVGNIFYSFGLVYGRTNTTTTTNFTWSAAPNGTTGVRTLTNIPSSVFGNADGVFLYSARDTGTNTIRAIKLFAQQFP